MSNRAFNLLLPLLSLAACARGATRTGSEPTPAETPPSTRTPTASSATSWTITPSSQTHRYRSTSKAIIDQNDSPIALRDSLTTTTDFTLSIIRNSRSVSYSAVIQSHSVQSTLRASLPTTTDQLPVSVSGRLEANQFSTELSPDCSNQLSSVTPNIQRLISSLPVQLQKDQTWTDSSTAKVCSGAIPVVLTSIRTYRVIGEADVRGSKVLHLSRDDRTKAQGEGSEGQHQIQIQTEGTGKAEVLVDRATGVLIESSATNVVALTVKASGRTQHFTQTSRELVVRQ